MIDLTRTARVLHESIGYFEELSWDVLTPAERDERAAWARAAALDILEQIMEPGEGAWDAWRSLNCTHGAAGMEEFTRFNGDFGNWLGCHQAMIKHIITELKREEG